MENNDAYATIEVTIFGRHESDWRSSQNINGVIPILFDIQHLAWPSYPGLVVVRVKKRTYFLKFVFFGG